jgi:hypothetical protein
LESLLKKSFVSSISPRVDVLSGNTAPQPLTSKVVYFVSRLRLPQRRKVKDVGVTAMEMEVFKKKASLE